MMKTGRTPLLVASVAACLVAAVHGQINHGQVQRCGTGRAVTGACTSGRDRDCGNDSHRIRCSSGSSFFTSDTPIGDWRGKNVINPDSKQAWLFCDSGQAIQARCAGGRDRDCRLTNGLFDHGIRCTDLSPGFRLIGEEQFVCSGFGNQANCPAGFVATASCASGENSDCEWSGCSGRSSYTGLICQQFEVVSTGAPTKAPTQQPTPRPTPTLAPSNDRCEGDTLNLLESTERDYNDTDITISNLELDGRRVEVVDFATNAAENAVFESSCERAGGRYVEISYEAICIQGNERLEMFVGGHPRCYSQFCGDDDNEEEQDLFELFTLRATEARNGRGFACTGTLTPGLQSGCGFETNIANEAEDTIRGSVDIVTRVMNQRRFFNLFNIDNAFDVTFQYDDLEQFRAACEAGGFQFGQESKVIACGDEEYDVMNIPLCLGSSCLSGEEGFDRALVQEFRRRVENEVPASSLTGCTVTAKSSCAVKLAFLATSCSILGSLFLL